MKSLLILGAGGFGRMVAENQQTFHYVFPPIVFLLISYTISYHRSGPGDSYFHKKLRRITGSRILRSFFVFILEISIFMKVDRFCL